MRTHEVSSTTAERNEVKRDAGGLDRAKHGKPEGQKLNKVKLLAISLFRYERHPCGCLFRIGILREMRTHEVSSTESAMNEVNTADSEIKPKA